MSIYELKPRFQGLLRPVVGGLANAGVTANQVTVAACAISIAIGALLSRPGVPSAWFALIPVWMFVRMAFNAIDGMLAREFGQKSNLGAYLNELTDVVSDAALYLPFAFVAPLAPAWVLAVVFLGALSEFAGVLGQTIGASRRYDGPMGKSDRAFVFGALGLWVSVAGSLPEWAAWLMPAIAAAVAWTVVNRIRRGLGEVAQRRG